MRKTISIEWSTNDVKCVRPDLDEKQRSEVLEYADERHDYSEGITWYVLEEYAETLFPMERETHNAVKNFKDLQNVALIGFSYEEIDAAWKAFITPKEFAKR